MYRPPDLINYVYYSHFSLFQFFADDGSQWPIIKYRFKQNSTFNSRIFVFYMID